MPSWNRRCALKWGWWARLEYDGRIQHGGYLLGVQHGVEVAFEGADGQSNGFQHYLKTPQPGGGERLLHDGA